MPTPQPISYIKEFTTLGAGLETLLRSNPRPQLPGTSERQAWLVHRSVQSLQQESSHRLEKELKCPKHTAHRQRFGVCPPPSKGLIHSPTLDGFVSKTWRNSINLPLVFISFPRDSKLDLRFQICF